MSDKKVEVKKTPTVLTYEQLKNVAQQLSVQVKNLTEENKQLKEYCEQMNYTNLYKRTDYLFDIITLDNKYLSDGFKRECGKEIERLFTRPTETDK